MKTTIAVNRPYVHGTLQVSWIGEVVSRVHVHADALTINKVPVIIESVLVCEGDVWRPESFSMQRVTRKSNYPFAARPHPSAGLKTSRRNQERAREEILNAVSAWAGGRPQEQMMSRAAEESRGEGAALVELLGVAL